MGIAPLTENDPNMGTTNFKKGLPFITKLLKKHVHLIERERDWLTQQESCDVAKIIQ